MYTKLVFGTRHALKAAALATASVGKRLLTAKNGIKNLRKARLPFRLPAAIYLLAANVSVSAVQAQKGPGGVSVESGAQSTCRVWFDAATLITLADGDPVTNWPDISNSVVNDAANVPSGQLPPYFRDDPANSINGYPSITFEDGRYLQINSSPDLNLSSVTYTKSVFLAFRTSTDVLTKQVIYEEGGCWRGFNVYIHDGYIYVGAYDFNDGGLFSEGIGPYFDSGYDQDGTPQWGYTFTRTPIQANTTYVVSTQFSAPQAGVLSTDPLSDTFFIRAWLNGAPFSHPMDFNMGNLTNTNGANTGTNGIGTLYIHPDPIGLGAINDNFLDKEGNFCNKSGQRPFKGLLSELCYYNDLLNETQRIILENYLGAKYFANFIVNNKYAHKPAYGNEVIGIGQETNSASNRHTLSQGRNPFSIQPSGLAQLNAPNQYFLTGHNKGQFSYSSSNVPDNSPNIQRLRRIWRVDKSSNDLGEVRIRVNTADLPPAPSGFSKLVLIVDQTSANFPNFTLPGTQVHEMPFVSALNSHAIDFNFPDNAFFTFGWVRPAVNFLQAEDFAMEGNPPPDSTLKLIDVGLNYTPHPLSGAHQIDYLFVEQTALRVQDFNYSNTVQSAGVSFGPGVQHATIPVWIKNDLIPENPSTETFLIVLHASTNTTPGLNAGQRDTLIFSIYDDDPPPVASFAGSTSNYNEGDGSVTITVVRTGDISSTSSLRITRGPVGNQGTATYDTDYQLLAVDGWLGTAAGRYIPLSFAPGESVKTATIRIIDDEIDEYDETIVFRLTNLNSIGVDGSSILWHTVTIVDNDPEPVASFVSAFQSGFESVGQPFIYVELDRQSAKDVEVTYEISPLSTATDGVDYTAASPGIISFPPMELLGYPLIFISNTDETPEPDETVIFQLTGAQNATIGNPAESTYTIIDYAPFEWRGAAGVGQLSDNIIWLDMDRVGGSHGTSIQNLTNFSPRNISLVQNATDSQGQLQTTSNLINGRKTILLDGNDQYDVENSPFINTFGFTGKKSFFFVIRTGSSISSTAPQVIYKQGAGNRGLSIYIASSRLYFNMWNLTNNGPESPWGGTDPNVYSNASLRRYAHSHVLAPNTSYIVSCHYDKDATDKIAVYVNGRKGDRTETSTDVGRLYSHGTPTSIGGNSGSTRIHANSTGISTTSNFTGLLAEMIKFHEPQMNETRRIIIENYLSAKYNIPLHTIHTPQVFNLGFANHSNPNLNFGYQVAGIGSGATLDADEVHLDAQGISQVRIRQPNALIPQSFMIWGHNNVPLTTAYPYSFSNLPSGVFSRSGRVWKSFSQGNLEGLSVLFNFSEIENPFAFGSLDLKLLVHTNSDPQNFTNATVIDAAQINSGPVVQFQNVNIPSGAYFTIASASSMLPLPVELLNFNAILAGTHVDLYWSTATELNSDYFEIQRTGEELQWATIATVEAAGTSNYTTHYHDKDRSPLSGISYYRLKQVDQDGSWKYSDPVAVVKLDGSFDEDIFIYPNPARGRSVMLRIPMHLSGPGSIKIIDLKGKVLYTKLLMKETLEYELDISRLSKGIYIVAIQNDLIYEGKKLIIQ